jgi:hypothetical protein
LLKQNPEKVNKVACGNSWQRDDGRADRHAAAETIGAGIITYL